MKKNKKCVFPVGQNETKFATVTTFNRFPTSVINS
jgi:hypothetical protein